MESTLHNSNIFTRVTQKTSLLISNAQYLMNQKKKLALSLIPIIFLQSNVALNRECFFNIIAYVSEDNDRLNRKLFLTWPRFSTFSSFANPFSNKIPVTMQTKGEFVNGCLYNWLGNSNVKQCFGTCSQFF